MWRFMWRKREFYGVIWRCFARVKCWDIMSGFGKCCDCRESHLLCDLPKVLTDKSQVCVACERLTFLLAHRRWGTFREEERLRLSVRNSILMTLLNVYIINPVVMGFQMQICSILRFSWSILVIKWCVHLRMSSSNTQMLLEKTVFHKYCPFR